MTHATNKFIARFAKVEERVTADGKNMADLPLCELDEYWDAVKKEQK